MQHVGERDCGRNVLGGGPWTGTAAGGVSLAGGGGVVEGRGAYKTQTVKGVGVESPEEEVGRGLLIAVVIVSAIVGEVGVGVCSAMG